MCCCSQGFIPTTTALYGYGSGNDDHWAAQGVYICPATTTTGRRGVCSSAGYGNDGDG
jgi:hypothetical protein